MVSAVAGGDTLAVAGGDTLAVAGGEGFATTALPPATHSSVDFTDLSSSIGSTGRYSFIQYADMPSFIQFADMSSFIQFAGMSSFVRFADMFSFVVRSSSARPSMVTMRSVRGCATAHSSQGAPTGGSATAGVAAGNLENEVLTSFALQGGANYCAATLRVTMIMPISATRDL